MANPTANITSQGFTGKNSDTIGFVPGPDTRGTIDIVYGCVVVLITAIWTVLHINIPAVGDSSWRVLFRRLRWGCVSIFAPDFLTLVAAAQWDSASKSVAQMRALLQAKEDPEKWCLQHAFYANSGGFLLQTPDSNPFPINAASTHYLVFKGYIALPDITVEEIWDKSKADVFAKGAAILQGVWLIVQSTARFVQGLALTPLELFTLAFVVSTAMSYFFWWRKPQNVSTPTVLVCRCSVARIRAEAGLSEGGWERTPMDFVEREGQKWMRRETFSGFDLEAGPQAEQRISAKTSTEDVTLISDDDKVETNELKFCETKCSDPDALPTSPPLSPTCTGPSPSQSEFKFRRKDSEITLVGVSTSPTSPSTRASTSAPGTSSPLKKGLDMIDSVDLDLSSKPGCTTTIINTDFSSKQQQQQPVQRIPDDAYMPAHLSLKVLGSLVILSMIHSCIHLLGWNLDYPSDIEKELWRVSAITLTAMSCIAVGVVRLLDITEYKGRYSLVWVWVNTNWEPTVKKNDRVDNKSPSKNDRMDKSPSKNDRLNKFPSKNDRLDNSREEEEEEEEKGSMASRLARAGQVIAMDEWFGDVTFWEVFLALATMALVLARCYIIMEAIISLRALPQDAFVTIHWLNLIPHV